uniref:Uncharacterized protein n=1 Tax=Amphimedon queenslandica TaxID=400682 RepID=A0A1X7TCN8_AMPQE
HQLILRYTPTTGLTGLDDEDEKRWLNKTAGSSIFGFPFRQGLEPRYGYHWSPQVKIRSSIKSGNVINVTSGCPHPCFAAFMAARVTRDGKVMHWY